ncbi:Hypothetical predicted protein [Olea europaea subsp. europaea]|uniref:Uncharacterized protein n=1 Tax=Olea europaea subsp. europaea TaxID=158383 RepID=A0A8S0RT11_OLEEU|nr:Hypothetical predicted protein [Olea europaea subsp. europaea]
MESPSLPTNEDNSMQSPSKKEESVKSSSDSSHKKDNYWKMTKLLNWKDSNQLIPGLSNTISKGRTHWQLTTTQQQQNKNSLEKEEKFSIIESPAYTNEPLESQLEKEEHKEESVNPPSDSSTKKDKLVKSPTYMNEQLEL